MRHRGRTDRRGGNPGAEVRPRERGGEFRRVRGGLVGLTVGLLAVAAHGLAGGDLPGSDGLALLLAVASAAGMSAAVLPLRSPLAVPGWLMAGQVVSHGALTLTGGHEHASAAVGLVSDRLMFGAHAVAAICCAALILVAERLYGFVSRAVRVATTRPAGVPPRSGPVRWPSAAGHIHHLLDIGAIGPRAPPVVG